MILQEGMDSTIQRLSDAQQVKHIVHGVVNKTHFPSRLKASPKKQRTRR